MEKAWAFERLAASEGRVNGKRTLDASKVPNPSSMFLAFILYGKNARPHQ